jgi:hypothetical protein
MTPTYAQGNSPYQVPLSTLISFFKIIRAANRIDDFLQQSGGNGIAGGVLKIQDVVSLFQTLDAANRLNDLVSLTGDPVIEVDTSGINLAKDYLFKNQIHLQSVAAASMANVANPGCPNHRCPHIPH